MFRESSKRSENRQSSQNSLTHGELIGCLHMPHGYHHHPPPPPNLKPTYYTLLQLRMSWPLKLCYTHSPFARQTSGKPNQVVWATDNGCSKPRARILATGALHVLNHVKTLDQLTLTSFHKRTS